MMLYLTGRQLLRPIMKRSSCNIATDFTVMSPTFKCSYHRFHYSPRRFSYIKRTKSRKRTFTTPSNKYSTKASTSANKPNIPSLLIGTGLVCGGLAALTEKSWRNPIQINSVTRLEEPILEFQHPYNKKPLWWRIWFATKRLGYLIVLWIPCSTVALAAWLTGDGSVRAKWLRLMVQTIEWAGCSFQKFGQWLSMRPDLLPPDIIEALSELRDNTAEHDMEHNRAMFRTSFGYELDDFFDFFDPKPIASASVGQVHRARLKQKYAMEDGSLEVAVKVRHPRVLDETWIDTTMIFAFMDNSGGLLTMPFSLKDFTFMLQKQFDFEWEAYNMSKFAENFSKETSSSQLRFPSVSGDILSPCVLVESWGKGSSVDNMFSSVGQNWEVRDGNDNSKDMKIKKELATVIFDMNMKMFMRDNFIHGDLHAGNLLYDRDSGALTVLDAGLISQIPPAMNANFVLFIQGMCGGDANAITDQLLVFDNRNSIPGLVNEEVQIQRSELLQTVQQACDHWVDPKTGMAPDG
jgi:predicted unusual protein kinase regulating ubiquinone biosynthesis (AarF/ABC1/UbiB family)